MTSSSSGSPGVDSDEPVSIAVVHAIAAHRDVDPTDLPPLYEWVDPDALDALFQPTRAGGPRRGRLEFAYDGQTVTVDSTGEVTITIDGSAPTGAIATGREQTRSIDG